MSSPLDRQFRPDEPSPYAPKWVRDPADAAQEGSPPLAPRDFGDAEARHRSDVPESVAEEGLVIERYRVPPSLDPTLVPQPRSVPAARIGVGIAARFALGAAIVAIVVLFVLGKLPPWTSAAIDHKDEAPSFGSRFSGQNVGNAAQPKSAAPQLGLGRAATLAAGEAFPLGISLSGAVEDASIVIDGLAAGTTVTAGRSSGSTTWQIPVTAVRDALVRPPHNYSGPMDLVVELRLADDTAVDRKLLHLDWAAAANPAPAAAVKPAPTAAVAPTPVAPRTGSIRRLERDEISDLMNRGEAFIASGDLAAARLVLQRAAEAGDPRAALLLAGTYDPMTLERLGIHGFASDIGKARAWYERAKEFGSAEALRRLEMLVSRDH